MADDYAILDERVERQPAEVPMGTEGDQPAGPEASAAQRRIMIVGIVGGILILAVLIAAIYMLLLPSTDTAKIRDVFIIVMALESLIIGVTLIVLMVQLAQLINLLQNEIKPILDSTQETANTLRGTTLFLSDNVVGPVLKLNEYLAALRSMLGVMRVNRRK